MKKLLKRNNLAFDYKENKVLIRARVVEEPKTSISRRSRQVSQSETTVWRILFW